MRLNSTGNKPHKGISKKLHYCESCNKVWELDYHTNKYLYYKNFPTYKLQRKRCIKCK